MELIALAIIGVLLAAIYPAILAYNYIKYWNKERRNLFFKALTIFSICFLVFVGSVYLLAGVIMIMVYGHVTFADEWSPFTNKLVFGYVFGVILLLAFYMTVGFGGGSAQVLIRTIKGDNYKHYGGIG